MSKRLKSSRKSRRPVVLLDRCIPPGVGKALTHFDIEHRTLDDIYGHGVGQDIEDVRWIEDSAAEGLIALTQNFRIARVHHEAEAIRTFGARVLSYHRASLTKEAKALILGRHMQTVRRLHDHSGPAFWRVSPLNVLRDI
ncbi:hypothetical protein SAMN04490220_0406 [Rhodococcus jostii]|uniref:VapC45 PIN like domain-containing protein n=1 Tax=Rhodococcus jostii TaxID=132919 RepID=A0A1H4IR30_RHOJO|nr:hypothetical protein SAMN04490220_0406 [Rhodococcus jostii]